MNRTIELTTTAQSIPESFSADISIVIDVLRASSVIITALANNTPFIIPTASIEEAHDLSKRYTNALLAGERQAVKIEGFDRGNSPLEGLSGSQGKPLILTTTNGTLTLSKVTHSKEVIIASFLNLQAVADYVNSSKASKIHIACAGTNGNFSLDDFLMAGGLTSKFSDDNTTLDDLSIAAAQLYQNNYRDLHRALNKTTHYNTLFKNGFIQDLDFCLQLDLYDTIGKLIEDKQGQLTIQKV